MKLVRRLRAQSLIALAAACERVEKNPLAIRYYRRALRWDPGRRDVWHRLGELLLERRKNKAAQDAFEKSLGSSPRDEVLRRMLAAGVKKYPRRRRALAFVERTLPLVCEAPFGAADANGSAPRIFVYWDSGFENAPPIVKACHQRLLRVNGSEHVVPLDRRSWRAWVDIPQHVLDKLPENTAHFSDVLRVALLSRYGGVWADATVWVTGPILPSLEMLTSEGFFCYRINEFRISNWFLCSSGENRVASLLFRLLCEYWREHDKVTHYFMFHHFFESLYFLDERVKRGFDRAPVRLSRDAHALQRILGEPFDERKYRKACEKSCVQKLTYKLQKIEPTSESLFHRMEQGMSLDP